MRPFLISASSVLALAAAVPYIVQIIKGKTKPRIVSWFTWTLLTGIAAAASFSDHQIGSGVLLVGSTTATLAVVILGLKYGDRHFSRVDIVCQACALVGLGLWLTLDSPAIAVVVSVAVDLMGGIPSLIHCWQKPYEETWISFVMASISGALTLAAVQDWHITSALYPAYLLVINSMFAAIIIIRHRYVVDGEPVELRAL